ncbi:MAG: PAS domain-containing protein [Chloroflexota bacterium]
MATLDWTKEFPAAITICDCDGSLVEMNDRAADALKTDGGRELIGKSILECHPEPARTKTRNLLAAPAANVHTIEKDGIKKLIYLSPWFQDGKYAGLVELSIEIPFDLPHFIRS